MTAPRRPAVAGTSTRRLRQGAAAVLRSGLPRSRSGRIVAAATALDATANGTLLASATLYFVGFIGISAVAVGGTLAVANILGLVSPIPGGTLADRFGARRVYVALALVRAAGFVGCAFVTGYAGYLAVTCAIVAAARASIPLPQVIVAESEAAAERTRTMACLRATTNVGLTVGFTLAAAVQAVHSRAAFAGLFAFSAAAFVAVAYAIVMAGRVVGTLPAGRAPAGGSARAGGSAPADHASGGSEDSPARSPYRDRPFLTMAAANAVLMLHDSVLFILLPLWLVQHAGLPATVSSVLLVVNTGLTVLLQVYVARFARGLAASLRLLRVACLSLVVACALFAAVDRHGQLVALLGAVLAVVSLTAGENLHSAAGWELSFELSPPSARGRYLSVFSMGMSVQLIVGPVLMTAVVLPAGAIGLLALACLFVAGTAVTTWAVRPAATAAPRYSLVPAERVS